MELTADNLANYVSKANRIKSIDSMSKEKIDPSSISNYYKNTGVLYRRFHSSEGAMHLPVKVNDKESHKQKLLFQARSVEDLIKKNNYKSIVELGCGTGFNSIYLARVFPTVQFTAMDITEDNLQIGKANADGLANLTFVKFNFDLDPHAYKADLIFAVETLCHSVDLSTLLKNLGHCLNPNGRLVIFDGYERLASQYEKLNSVEQDAYRLVCLGFVLNRFQKLQEVYDETKANNLVIELERDYTKQILPNWKTFQRGSRRILEYPWLTKFCLGLRILPYYLYLQALAGFFGATLLERNFLSYYQFILKRQ